MNNMKAKYLMIIAATMMVACQKNAGEAIKETEKENPLAEIFLVVGDDDINVDTKTTAVTAVPSTLYWGATTGSGTESAKWSTASSSVSSSKISTGKYQTYSPTTYNYYVSNVNFTTNGDSSVSASNTTDVVCGRTSTNSTTPSVTLNHIFARTGSFTMNTQSGYTISNVSWTISGAGTAGTYSMKNGTWSGLTALGETSVGSGSDLYLVPGTYTIKCSYTLTKGDWSASFTKSASVTLVAGKINNITGTASGGAATEIVISVSLTAWSSETHNLSFS